MSTSEVQLFADRVGDAARELLGGDGELCAWEVKARWGPDAEVCLGAWWGDTRQARVTWTWSGIRNDPEGVLARCQVEQLAARIRVEEACGELEERVASVHERVACPKCGAPVGEVCRAMPDGYRGMTRRYGPPSPGRVLKHPHRWRLTADGISLR